MPDPQPQEPPVTCGQATAASDPAVVSLEGSSVIRSPPPPVPAPVPLRPRSTISAISGHPIHRRRNSAQGRTDVAGAPSAPAGADKLKEKTQEDDDVDDFGDLLKQSFRLDLDDVNGEALVEVVV